MNCEDNSGANITNPSTESIIGSWKIIESGIGFDDVIWYMTFEENGNLTQYTYGIGETYYLLQNNNYEVINNDTIAIYYKDSTGSQVDSAYADILLKEDSLFVSFLIFETDTIVDKYIQYENILPPTSWPDSVVVEYF